MDMAIFRSVLAGPLLFTLVNSRPRPLQPIEVQTDLQFSPHVRLYGCPAALKREASSETAIKIPGSAWSYLEHSISTRFSSL